MFLRFGVISDDGPVVANIRLPQGGEGGLSTVEIPPLGPRIALFIPEGVVLTGYGEGLRVRHLQSEQPTREKWVGVHPTFRMILVQPKHRLGQAAWYVERCAGSMITMPAGTVIGGKFFLREGLPADIVETVGQYYKVLAAPQQVK